MELTGLGLTELLTVLGGFAAAVTALYLLKLRRRQVTVPFVHLWQRVLAEKQTTRLFSALKRLLSLLVALMIVAALALAMADPRTTGASDAARTTVVLVDASASMQATDVEPDRLGEARERVGRLIDAMGGDDRLLIAQMDKTTVPLSPLTSETRPLRDALDALTPTDLAADLPRGLRFAMDVLRGQPRPTVVLVSDGVLGPPGAAAERLRAAGVDVRWIRVGEGGRNVGVSAFSVRRYPLDKSRSEVLVEIENAGDAPESVELTLLGDSAPLELQRLEVRPGERLRRIFSGITGADRTLEARVGFVDGTRDALPADDRAYARLPERRRARVMSVSANNLYLSAALLLDEYLDVVEVTPDEYPAPGQFDVVIFDAWVPPSPPDAHAIYLYPVPAEDTQGPWDVTGAVERPYFDRVEREHPIVQFTALGDVNVAEGLAVELEEDDRVIAGDRGAPLIVTGSRGGHRVVGLLFDVRRSDLPLRVAWPLLLLNSIDWFVQEDAGYLSSYETGDVWHVPLPEAADAATLVSPDGGERSVPVVNGRAVCSGSRAGFYRLRAGDAEDTFAANLGPSQEAQLTPPAELLIGGVPAPAPQVRARGVRTELWAMLVVAALVIILLEWFTYHRRWTV